MGSSHGRADFSLCFFLFGLVLTRCSFQIIHIFNPFIRHYLKRRHRMKFLDPVCANESYKYKSYRIYYLLRGTSVL